VTPEIAVEEDEGRAKDTSLTEKLLLEKGMRLDSGSADEEEDGCEDSEEIGIELSESDSEQENAATCNFGGSKSPVTLAGRRFGEDLGFQAESAVGRS
jgi:hypothetical protein